VVIVNETFVRRFWPDQNPVGKRIVVGRWPEAAEVIGISADIKNKGLAQDTQAQLYLAFPQLPWGNMNLLVRTSVLPRSISSAVRAQISAVDADQPVTDIQTVEDLVDGSRAQPRFTMLLLGILSLTAVGLAVVGIYGVLAYSVAARRRELGIRLALGAERADVLLLVVRQGLMLAAGGIAIGLAAALLLTRWMASLLYGVGAHDPATFAAAPMLFLCVALLASYLPAQRATKVDPAKTLRES